MIKHIVMFRLNGDEQERKTLAKKFKEAIEALPLKIEALDSVEVGIDNGDIAGNWDIVLSAICADNAALTAYSTHPEHLDCVSIIKSAIDMRACVDYTL